MRIRTTGLIIGILVTSFGIALIYGCKKENMAPGLEITQPVPMQYTSTSDSLLITGTASDDKELHEFMVVVRNAAGDTVSKLYLYVHGLKTYPFSFFFHAADTGLYHLDIAAQDHNFEWFGQSVDFQAASPARIFLFLPADSTVIPPTDSLRVNALLTDNVELKQVSIAGLRVADGDTAFFETYNIAGVKSSTFSNYYHQTDTGAYFLNVALTNYAGIVTQKGVRYFVRE